MSEFPRLSQAPTEPDACLRMLYPGTVMYPRLAAVSLMCGMLLSRWYDVPCASCCVVLRLRLYTEEGVPVEQLLVVAVRISYSWSWIALTRSCTARSCLGISMQISRALAAGSSSTYLPSRTWMVFGVHAHRRPIIQ